MVTRGAEVKRCRTVIAMVEPFQKGKIIHCRRRLIRVDLAHFVGRRVGHKRKVGREYNATRCRIHRCIGILTIGIK